MSKNKIEVASVLSFEKKLVPSDAFFYSGNWEEIRRYDDIHRSQEKLEEFKKDQEKKRSTGQEVEKLVSPKPLSIIAKSVRGTISNRLKVTSDKDVLKLNQNISSPNPQTVDACALTEHHDTLKVSFTLKVLSNLDHPSACNDKDFLATYRAAVQEYSEKFGFEELAKRYASNIANARFLWRNRVGAEKVDVLVTINDQEPLIFDALSYSLKNFDQTDANLEKLSAAIAKSFKNQDAYLLIKVEAYALVGKAQEVYPSEELVLDKNDSKDKKSKILYEVNGVAAMHSQKVGNALRTIDTWYPEFDDHQMPIAVEPYGAVTNLGRAFRTPKDKNDFFTLFDKYATGESLESDEQKHYVIAVLIRGGVFGKSAKE